MKSVILYPYGPLTGGTRCCRMLHAKNLAITSAIYTIVSVCGWGSNNGAYTQCERVCNFVLVSGKMLALIRKSVVAACIIFAS